MTTTTCGFCNGTGRALTRAYDREGRAQEQRSITCEYCGGDGVTEGGDGLLGATGQVAPPEHKVDLERRGSPTWA